MLTGHQSLDMPGGLGGLFLTSKPAKSWCVPQLHFILWSAMQSACSVDDLLFKLSCHGVHKLTWCLRCAQCVFFIREYRVAIEDPTQPLNLAEHPAIQEPRGLLPTDPTEWLSGEWKGVQEALVWAEGESTWCRFALTIFTSESLGWPIRCAYNRITKASHYGDIAWCRQRGAANIARTAGAVGAAATRP